MPTTLANERRLQRQRRESHSQSFTEFPAHGGGLYPDDDDDDDEEELELVRGDTARPRDDQAIEAPARRNKEELRAELEEEYNRDEQKKQRKPRKGPTLEKLATAVMGSNGLVALPTTCKEYTQGKAPKSRHDTAGARKYMARVFSAYQDCAEDWVVGWNWQEACSMVQRLKSKKQGLKPFLQQQRNAVRRDYLTLAFGDEKASHYLQQLEQEEAALGSEDLPLAQPNDDVPQDDDEEQELGTTGGAETETPQDENSAGSNDEQRGTSDTTTTTTTAASPSLSRVAAIVDEDDDDEEEEILAPRTRRGQEPVLKKRKIIVDDDDEEREFGEGMDATKDADKRESDDDDDNEMELEDTLKTSETEPNQTEKLDNDDDDEMELTDRFGTAEKESASPPRGVESEEQAKETLRKDESQIDSVNSIASVKYQSMEEKQGDASDSFRVEESGMHGEDEEGAASSPKVKGNATDEEDGGSPLKSDEKGEVSGEDDEDEVQVAMLGQPTQDIDDEGDLEDFAQVPSGGGGQNSQDDASEAPTIIPTQTQTQSALDESDAASETPTIMATQTESLSRPLESQYDGNVKEGDSDNESETATIMPTQTQDLSQLEKKDD